MPTRMIVRIFAKYRRIWLEALGLSVAAQVMTLLFPIIMQVMVDRVLIRRAEGTLGLLVAAMVAITLFEGVFSLVRAQLLEHTSARVHAELGSRVLHHLLALPLIYFDRQRMSEVVGRMRELGRLRRVVEGDSLGRVTDFVLSLLMIGVMVFYSPMLTAVLMVYLLAFCGVLLLTTPVFKRRMDAVFRANAESDGLLVESLARIEAIKCTAIEREVRGRIETSLVSESRTRLGLKTATNWFTMVNHLFLRAGTILMLVVGGHLVLAGELTIGEFFAFQFIVLRLSLPVAFMIKSMLDVHESGVSFRALSTILAAETEVAEPGAVRAPEQRIVGSLTLEDVDFSYAKDGERAVRKVNLHIPAGQIVAFIGPSGSGKTTLLKLALGLYRPTAGRVLVDGLDLASLDPRKLRPQVGIVQQDNPVFAMSVRDNIAIADPHMPFERIKLAATQAGAHDFIMRLPDAYDTLIGNYASGLSGGERQRIAIARALVTNPRILVFDEATSALDFETERVIQANMHSICADRTVIIVSHRLSAIRQANRIVTLTRGAVIEDGSHEELLHANGWYAALYGLQTGREQEAGRLHAGSSHLIDLPSRQLMK